MHGGKEVSMPTNKLREYLESNDVQYKVIEHALTYTAQETAASAHVPGKQLAKTVMIKIDDRMAMVVIPAPHRVNFDRLKKYIGAEKVELASEREFKEMFPDCEPGAMPPFGNLYGLEVYAAESLADEMEIAFCAGSHTESILLQFKDFERLVEPKIFDISWEP
jgi:Ala-tRNA(Pro) deacylase